MAWRVSATGAGVRASGSEPRAGQAEVRQRGRERRPRGGQWRRVGVGVGGAEGPGSGRADLGRGTGGRAPRRWRRGAKLASR